MHSIINTNFYVILVEQALFFYDKQGHQGLRQDATHAIQTHVEEAFSEWILCSATSPLASSL